MHWMPAQTVVISYESIVETVTHHANNQLIF